MLRKVVNGQKFDCEIPGYGIDRILACLLLWSYELNRHKRIQTEECQGGPWAAEKETGPEHSSTHGH